MRNKKNSARLIMASTVVAAGIMVAATSASSSGAQVTNGDLHPFAAGATGTVSGHAQMVRTSSGATTVSLHVEGLRPGGQYASHVHAAACAVGDADGHYKLDPAGPATPPNEIWPGDGPFVANDAGIANVNTQAAYTAGANAVAVVVHDLSLPSTANKVACADLG
jgi:superoxide dismutase, Cu-Zn family